MNPASDGRLSAIARDLDLPETASESTYRYLLEDAGSRLRIRLRDGGNSIFCQLDTDRFIASLRSFPASRHGVFNQAIGRKTVTVLDATGGMGNDSLLLCGQGYRVTTLERNALLVVMMRDAFLHLGDSEWAGSNTAIMPTVIHDDARDWLRARKKPADCIYLDPMFPPKRKSSAAVNKDIRLLQELCGSDEDSTELLDVARTSNARRVVVKRPRHAEPLAPDYSDSFSGKLVRYDLYLQ